MAKTTARLAADEFRKSHEGEFKVDGKTIYNVLVGYGTIDFLSDEGNVRHLFDDDVAVETVEVDPREAALRSAVGNVNGLNSDPHGQLTETNKKLGRKARKEDAVDMEAKNAEVQQRRTVTVSEAAEVEPKDDNRTPKKV